MRYKWKDKTAGENMGRANLDLFGKQLDLVKAIRETGTPVIIVLVNGVEEIKKGDVTAAFNEVEDASLVLENAKTDKEKLKASQNLKRIASRAQALTFF